MPGGVRRSRVVPSNWYPVTWSPGAPEAFRTPPGLSSPPPPQGVPRRRRGAHHPGSRLPAAADALDELCDELGRLDVLVNNAGIGTTTPFVDLALDDVRRVLDVDLVGPLLCGQKAALRMIGQGHGGRIVNVTSVHEHQPRAGAGPYCAAKAGLGLLAQVMALELAEHGITVNAVAPGEIATPMTGQEDTDVHTGRRPGVPLGRPGDAREVAAVIAFLAGPDSSYVTGASWSVDGGMLRMGPMAGSHLESDDWRRP